MRKEKVKPDNEELRHITVARDGRRKKYRIRVRRKFDSSFSDIYTAILVRDFEART
jgi:hypothetical protein